MASGNPPRTDPRMLCIAGDAAAIGRAVAAARGFAAAQALPPETASRLAIIVEELVANLLDHADLPDNSRLELGLHRAGDRVTVELIDPGTAFDPRIAVPAAPIPERGGHAGLALVRAFARIDSYDRIAGRNRLRLSLPITD